MNDIDRIIDGIQYDDAELLRAAMRELVRQDRIIVDLEAKLERAKDVQKMYMQFWSNGLGLKDLLHYIAKSRKYRRILK